MLFRKYSNANDPRTVIFGSHSNKKLGVVFNWAHPSSVRKRLLPRQLLGLALIASAIVGLCIGVRHLWLVNLAVLPFALMSNSDLKRCAEEELVRHPGPIGPRTPDGLGAAEDIYTSENALRSFQLAALLVFVVVVPCLSVVRIHGGMIWYKALISHLFFGGLILSLMFIVMSLLPGCRNWARAALYLGVFGALLLCAKPTVEFCDIGSRRGCSYEYAEKSDPVEFCGVTFGTPSGVSTNGLSIRLSECTGRNGGKEVKYGTLYWIGVDESLRPADFFDFAEIRYSFKTLTPQHATFCAHFPKGATRKECIALLDEFSAKLNGKYGLTPDAVDSVQNEEEPVGFVPSDPPENLQRDFVRYWHGNKNMFYKKECRNDRLLVGLSAGETDFGERCAILQVGTVVVASQDEGVVRY